MLHATTPHFFNISTCTKGPKKLCFYHFDFELCFAPQGCPLLQHLNFQECCGVFSILNSTSASRHKAACNFSLHPPLEAAYFPASRAPTRLFYLFTHLHFLSLDSFSSLIFFFSLFSSLTLAPSAFQSDQKQLCQDMPSNQVHQSNGEE